MNKTRTESRGILGGATRILPMLGLGIICLTPLSSVAQPAPRNGDAVGREVLGGDLLRITVVEAAELDNVYPVSGDGTIDFGYVGRVQVEGYTLEELPSRLETVLTDRYFKNATVTVEISEYVSGSLLILGAVANPGSIPYEGNEIITLLEAIISVGGMTPRAARDQVKIFRWKTGGSMEREVISVDMKKIMDDYDFTRDEYLRPRDIIVVPELGQGDEVASEFLALGEFGDAGFHQISADMNMIRAVTVAGGLSREANLESARVLRPSGDGDYAVIPVDLARLFGSADMRMNTPIYPGDIIYVPPTSQASGGKVYFLGEIDNPGMHPLPVNKIDATLAKTILARGGLGQFSNGKAVKIQRKAPDGTQQTMVFDVESILKSGNFDNDIPLQDEDVIIISQRFFNF